MNRIAATVLICVTLSGCNQERTFASKEEGQRVINEVIDGTVRSLLTREAVPTEQAAIDIALALLRPIYGESVIDDERPFSAIRYKDFWYVSGSWPGSRRFKGGVAELVLRAKTGEVVYVSHAK